MNSKKSEFTGTVRVITEKAYLIEIDDDLVWIPDSLIELFDEPEENEEITFEIPEWLAESKSLI